MNNIRYKIKNQLLKKEPKFSKIHLVKDENGKLYNMELANRFNDLFKSNVFSNLELEKRVPKPVVEKLKDAINHGKTVDPDVADVVAQAIKEWALSKGCTHYSHWFFPMRDGAAEKHDSFINFFGNQRDLRMEFNGESLLRAEPDGSSFPTGGARMTHQARGYTAWDPSSPPFIVEGKNGNTLLIPSMFISWTGQALDLKTPLIRSIHTLSRYAVELLRLLGDEKTKYVSTTLGAEQEFFVIDRAYFNARPDLVLSGRTVLGAPSIKGQQMADHYFGIIPPRVLAFIQEVEEELWKLGVPTKTRHNEVSPSQHEMAPIFEESNIACDHNLLQMSILDRLAVEHELAVLLHEKPFEGLNGSGKHNNWSMATDTNINLLNPGKNPKKKKTFLAFLAAVIKAVDEHADLLRSSVATPGNDHRLGAHEAPPAIMSIYLGDVLHEVIQQIIEEDPENMSDNSETKNNISISSYLEMGELISPVERDKTDRNRTSPFAFTGNKFEFRAPGSSQALAQTNMILNAIVADAISEMIQKIHEIKEKKMKEKGLSEKDALELSIKIVIRDIFKKHSRIIFEGNGYSPEWIEEAKKRGLPNYKDSVEALSHITDEKNIQLFENLKILKKEELISRVEIFFEHWVNTNLIESKLIVDLTNTHVIPAAIKQQKIFSSSILNVKSVDPHLDIKEQEYQLKRLSTLLNQTILENRKLDEIIQKENTIEFSNGKERAEFIRDQILPLTKSVRKNVDVLEGIIEDSLWTLPKYQEMLFLK